jgi:hypothetical protein
MTTTSRTGRNAAAPVTTPMPKGDGNAGLPVSSCRLPVSGCQLPVLHRDLHDLTPSRLP